MDGSACRLSSSCRSNSDFGFDAISKVPLDRWDVESTGDGVVGGRFGGFIERWADFDAAVFGISTAEAAYLDPAQRVLLEVSHASLLKKLDQLWACTFDTIQRYFDNR